jgi:hypothetical protein
MNWKKTEEAITKAVKKQAKYFQIKDTVDYPLAFNVEMPDDYSFSNGNVSFRFADFVCTDMDDISLIESESFQRDDKLHIGLRIGGISIKGNYTISARMAPKIDLDTAGTMLNFDEDMPKAAGAKSGPGSSLTDEEQKEFLKNARDQRERLRDPNSPNGGKLMRKYEEHNEIYNELFIKNEVAREEWYNNGVTAEMAKDTHVAVNDDKIVNPKDVLYSNNQSYNANAFMQQLNVTMNTMWLDPNFDPKRKPDPNSKYTKASIAAMDFNKMVKQTGNGEIENEEGEPEEKITPLTANDVYAHINGANGEPPKTSIEELQNLFSQQQGDAGAPDAADKGWLILNEEKRRIVRGWYIRNLQQKAREEKIVPVDLWKGDCTTFIKNAIVNVGLTIDVTSGIVTIDKTDVSLPAFEFDLDDSSWTGKAAQIIRERLSQVYFVKSLITKQIELGVRLIVDKSVIIALS